MQFTSRQAACIARGIGEIRAQLGLVLYALAVMPNHVHIVVPRQTYQAEELCGIYKRAASRQLRQEGLHPFARCAQSQRDRLPTPWAELGWRIYLHSPEEVLYAIRYVERNPVVARLPEQKWDFVTPYGSS